MLFALALLFFQEAHANYLSYIDDKGTRHIVQSAEEIPEKYRESAKKSRAGDPSNATAAAVSTATGTSAGTASGTTVPVKRVRKITRHSKRGHAAESDDEE